MGRYSQELPLVFTKKNTDKNQRVFRDADEVSDDDNNDKKPKANNKNNKGRGEAKAKAGQHGHDRGNGNNCQQDNEPEVNPISTRIGKCQMGSKSKMSYSTKVVGKPTPYHRIKGTTCVSHSTVLVNAGLVLQVRTWEYHGNGIEKCYGQVAPGEISKRSG
jgi:hypothetical protein